MEERRIWDKATSSYAWTSSNATTTVGGFTMTTSSANPPDMGTVAWVIVPEPEPDDDRTGADRAA